MPVRTAAAASISSVFCLCPTGDSKGFTARFYFSIAHRCIPVRVDGFRRGLTAAETAYPFPSLIDWSRIVVNATVDEALSGALLQRLASMPQREVSERLAYMQRCAPWLVWGRNASGSGHERDAAGAAIHELRLRVSAMS